MKRLISIIFYCFSSIIVSAQVLPNPILFCTQVPNPSDFVSDMTGKTMVHLTKSGNNDNNLPFVINIQSFKSGIYTAIVTIDGFPTLHKVVISK